MAVAGDDAAREKVLAAARFDAAFRELLPKRLGVDPAGLPFYLLQSGGGAAKQTQKMEFF